MSRWSVRRPFKLRTRITASFVLLLALWGLLLAASLGYLLLGSSRRFYRERGEHMVRALAAQAGPLIYYEDITGLADLFQTQMKSNPNIRYIAVVDPTGNPIWSTFPEGVPSDLMAVPHDPASAGDLSTRLVKLGRELLYDYQAKKGRFLIRMGMSLSPVEDLRRRMTVYALWIGAGGLLAVLLMALYVSRPLEELSSAIERAVSLEQRTGGGAGFQDTLETSLIGRRFQELMDSLEERTKQLAAAKKLAYLGEVSATIAHEVNNPLGVLAMNTEFLADRAKAGELNEEAVREVSRLQIASKRATLAVQKFLQFARYSAINPHSHHLAAPGPAGPGATGDQLRPRPAHLPTIVQECLDLLADRIHLSRCIIRSDIPKDLPSILCDGQGLQQVVFNLLTNAIDASPEGSEIAVGVTLDKDGLYVRVSDQGGGMTDETLKRATEPFFTTKEEGLGLGLAISHSIVSAHGGTLELVSRLGKGTTATVFLPIREALLVSTPHPSPLLSSPRRGDSLSASGGLKGRGWG